MALHQESERQVIANALASGRLSVPDEHGFHHWIYTLCREDGQRVQPERTIAARDAQGHHIDALIFHCTGCGRTWQAAAEELRLS